MIMKKLILASSILLASIIPSLAFAAYDDVAITSSAVISAGGQSFNVEGDSNVIESITVTADDFYFILQANSFLKVSSPALKQIDSSAAPKFITDQACETNASYVKFGPTSESVTITVTPKQFTCPRGGVSSGGGSSGNSSGGGNSYALPTPVVISANATVVELQAQLNALLAQLNALQAGTAVSSGQVNSAKIHITQILSKGSRGNSVKGLQQFLNNQGFVISVSGAGSPGQETDMYGSLTEKAVGKFQEKYNIAKPGEPGYGRVGPKTRAKINEISGQ